MRRRVYRFVTTATIREGVSYLINNWKICGVVVVADHCVIVLMCYYI